MDHAHSKGRARDLPDIYIRRTGGAIKADAGSTSPVCGKPNEQLVGCGRETEFQHRRWGIVLHSCLPRRTHLANGGEQPMAEAWNCN